MINKCLKKMICSLFAVLMVITAVPANAIAFEMEQIGESVDAEEDIVASDSEEDIFFKEVEGEKAETLEADSRAKVDDAEIAERIKKLESKLVGTYFTANREPCGYYGGINHPNHPKGNCSSTAIIENGWFKTVFGICPSNTSKLCITGDSQTCTAFARMAHWYIFCKKDTEIDSVDWIVSRKTFNYTNAKKAKKGDIITLDGPNGYHEGILLGITSSGIKLLECNINGADEGSSKVFNKFTWSYGGTYTTMSIGRATNYTEVLHDYNNYGYCSHCGKYYEEINSNKIVSIEGTVKSDGKIYVKAHPYQGDSGVNQDELDEGTYKIIGKITKDNGKTWYKISYGSSKTGWIYPEDYYTIDINNTLNFELRMNTYSIPKGSSVWANDSSAKYNWYGKVSSSNNVSKITSVTFEILKSDGTLTASSNRIIKKPNATSYTVKTSDDTMQFSALAAGSYILRMSATDEHGKTGSTQKSFTITSGSSTTNVPVTGVNIEQLELVLPKGSTHALTAIVSPSNATNKSVTWSSDNTAVATVSSSGVVTAVSAGKAVITVTTKDGSYKDTCNVEVKEPVVIPVTDVVIVDEESREYNDKYQMVVGNSWQFGLEFFPYNATNKNVTWSTSNSSVATVSDSGLVKAVGAGSVEIKVTTQDGGFTNTIIIEVVEDTRFVRFMEDGSVFDQYHVSVGETFTIPDEVPTRPGYKFVGWKEPGTTGTDGWVTTKPSNGDYQTGYKYFIYGYEHNSDYTFFYGKNKNDVISGVKENPQVYGNYNENKLRYLYIVESADKGSSFYPGKSGSTYNYFTANYIGENGTTGTTRIYKTEFYLESTVYKQEATGGKIYQPGDSYNVTKDVIFTAVWEEEQEVSYGVTFDANGGIGGPLFARTIGTQFTVPEEIPTRENWVFLYWGGNKGIYRPGETHTISEDEELVAYWAPAWEPEITVGDVLVNPGDTIGVPIYIYNAKEPENTTIRFSVTSDAFTRTKYEFDEEIPEYGCLGTAYFEIPEDTEPGEYPVSFNLTEYKISSGYIITDTVKIFDGSITVTDKKICTVTIDLNDGSEPFVGKMEAGTELDFSAVNPEKEGYTFVCWRIAEKIDSNYDSYILLDKNEVYHLKLRDIVITPIYQKNDQSYPSVSAKDIVAKPGDTVTIQIEAQNVNGFVFGNSLRVNHGENIELVGFKNYYLDDLAENVIYEISLKIGEDIALGKREVYFNINEVYTPEGELWVVKDVPVTISIEKSNYGDLNGDKEVNIKDAYLARLIAAKLITATEVQSTLGDVDLDGKITAIDANLIRKYCVNIITKLPVDI